MKHFLTYVKYSYELILEAEVKANINLEHEVEAFVVHTFAKFMEQPNIPSDAIAIKMLSSANETGEIRKQHLQEIAQECMLIDGLELNIRRWPSKSYFIDMGRLALEQRAWIHRPPELFYERLAYDFTNISKILHEVKA
jgi:hypothetical protein